MNDIVTPRDTKQKLTDTLQNVYISMQPADVIIEALLAKPKHELEDHLPQIQKILKVRKQICKSKKKSELCCGNCYSKRAKCNGEKPCGRCVSRNSESQCVY